MKAYIDQLKYILRHGVVSKDRTGTGTISVFSPPEAHYDLTKGFPLVTTKKLFTRGIFEELLWFLSGSTSNRDLNDKGVHIWDEWANEYNDLGPIYGAQWRSWRGYYDGNGEDDPVDQISELIERIKNEPYSRRHIVSAWNVAELDRMALAPCHCFFQVYVRDQTLSLKLYQRSADMFLGVPFNIASYALLTHMLAAQTGNKPGRFIHTLGDAHIYLNHLEQVETQMKRNQRKLPTLTLNPDVKSIFDYRIDDIHIEGYRPHPGIKGEVSV